MSPRPTLRATSTSRLSSIVNDAMPSTSDGRDPAVVERGRDRLARERQLGVGESLAERGLADAGDRDPVLQQRCGASRRLPALELGRAALDEARDALGRVARCPLTISTKSASSSNNVARSTSSERLRSRLANPIVFVGPCASRSAHSRRGRLELAAGHDLVDEADALGLGRGEVVAEEHELLRLLQPDERGGAGTSPPPSGMRPRRTNTWMSRALSAAIARSRGEDDLRRRHRPRCR